MGEWEKEPVRRTVDVQASRVLDLRRLESKRTRIKGSAFCVTDDERKHLGGSTYYLVREPDNTQDAKAVAVYSRQGVRVGYLSSATGARLSPLMERMPADLFKVTGAGTAPTSIVMWVDVPLAGPMRAFAAEHAEKQ